MTAIGTSACLDRQAEPRSIEEKTGKKEGRRERHYILVNSETHCIVADLPGEMAFDFAAMLKQEMEQLNQKMSKNKIENESILSDDTLPKLSLLDSKVATLPENVFYIPRFISDQEAELLVKSLEKSNWTTLANRKLQNWGGVPHPR